MEKIVPMTLSCDFTIWILFYELLNVKEVTVDWLQIYVNRDLECTQPSCVWRRPRPLAWPTLSLKETLGKWKFTGTKRFEWNSIYFLTYTKIYNLSNPERFQLHTGDPPKVNFEGCKNIILQSERFLIQANQNDSKISSTSASHWRDTNMVGEFHSLAASFTNILK